VSWKKSVVFGNALPPFFFVLFAEQKWIYALGAVEQVEYRLGVEYPFGSSFVWHASVNHVQSEYIVIAVMVAVDEQIFAHYVYIGNPSNPFIYLVLELCRIIDIA
jgi:hypothetical protein